MIKKTKKNIKNNHLKKAEKLIRQYFSSKYNKKKTKKRFN